MIIDIYIRDIKSLQCITKSVSNLGMVGGGILEMRFPPTPCLILEDRNVVSKSLEIKCSQSRLLFGILERGIFLLTSTLQ